MEGDSIVSIHPKKKICVGRAGAAQSHEASCAGYRRVPGRPFLRSGRPAECARFAR